VPGALSLGVKRLGQEADHSPPSSAEVNNGGAIPQLPHTSLFCTDFRNTDQNTVTLILVTIDGVWIDGWSSWTL
jgi:hypothetical protein